MADEDDATVAKPFFRGLLVQPDCTNCPLKDSKMVVPEGNPRARIAFVGEGPGYMEVQQGRPFVGPSGTLLNKMFTDAGIVREDVWITNATLCRGKTVQYGGKTLSPDQAAKMAADHCRPRLIQELRIVKPKVVVGLGAQAVRSVYDKTASMKGRRGGIHILDLDEALANEVKEVKPDK